ncbi:uncharacterized protein LOC131008443 [Salvia miltiorrhiza]|uniref:uncharacterized protein LOC131008443 n=1 Tax=Salvia miltiorrhiza TaxID=226208 RepID=UPI0025AD3471|nr:uncharacterized protein LOC131008443 [Salvia miltiorrhiza]
MESGGDRCSDLFGEMTEEARTGVGARVSEAAVKGELERVTAGDGSEACGRGGGGRRVRKRRAGNGGGLTEEARTGVGGRVSEAAVKGELERERAGDGSEACGRGGGGRRVRKRRAGNGGGLTEEARTGVGGRVSEAAAKGELERKTAGDGSEAAGEACGRGGGGRRVRKWGRVEEVGEAAGEEMGEAAGERE